MNSTLDSLAAYTQWANAAWLAHLQTKCPADEYLLKMLSHITKAEAAWFQRIHGQAVDKNVFEQLSLERIAQLQREHAPLYASALGSDLARIIQYTRLNGEASSSSVADILIHLCTHAAHHRGQMASHASKMKYAMISTDYIVYSRMKS
jgi:uncharacterized damage-inducible protein DinB